MATYLTRTPSSSGSNTTWTFSAWIKRSDLGLDTVPFATGYSSPQIDESIINIGADDQLRFDININDATDVRVKSARKLRDTSGWYHIVVACDTTQGTASDRIKFYINGELETNLSNTDYPTQNQSTFFGDTSKEQKIGLQPRTSNYLFGVISHLHFCDGTAYDATAFGETDANGVWKINTSPSVTYGTNGFFILKNGNSVTDQSGNGNNWTVGGGTLTNTEDSPSNVFATMATPTWYDGTIANGGLTITTNQTSYRYQPSSIGVSSGKWYWEVKLTTRDNYALMGITDAPSPINVGTDWILGSGAYDYSVVYNTGGGDGHKYNNAGTSPTNTPGAFMGGFAQGDIIMFALDCDNNTLKIGTNDLWSNGSGSTNQTFANTTAISITAPASTNTGFYFPAVGDYGGAISVFDLNFGNGYFGTTAVASAGTNASGNGIFEYDVPTGYTALCTKGLNGE